MSKIIGKRRGKFIIFEGIDGSGKSTQAKMLANHLKRNGCKIEFIDFPQHGKKSAGLVDEYLTGKYGTSAEVSPFQASIFYACDRYDASFIIRDWLRNGKIVIADRYIGSNIGHQGGKIKNKKEWKRYLNWLYDLEYRIFKIPKPDTTFILRVSPKIAQSLSGKIKDKEKKAKKRLYLGKKKQDIHEKDLNHLINTERSYLAAAREYPRDFIVVNCMDKNRLLSPEEIHKEIWKIIKNKLKSVI